MATESTYYEVYLGDGLYASFDGYQILLHANGHDFEHGATDRVALEPGVVNTFLAYVKQLREKGVPI
jgi:hypothetical protein